MTHTYDWSKLDAGWRFEPRSASVRADALVHTTDRGTDRHFAIAALEYGSDPNGSHTSGWRMLWPLALDQLAKCRIPAPDVATVTELRPRDEYDWSRLEGSGWKAHTAKEAPPMLESERWNYYVGTGFLAFRIYGVVQTPEESWRVHNDVYALVAKCKRDWRDEVEQACDGLMELDQGPNRTQAFITGEPSLLTMKSDRTIRVLVNTTNVAHLLAMSLIIERLKKLGWREA